MSYNQSYILNIYLYNLKLNSYNSAHDRSKHSIYFTSAVLNILDSVSNFQLNQQLVLQKNSHITLAKNAHAQHKQSLNYSSSMLTHTHFVSTNHAHVLHMLTVHEQPLPPTSISDHKHKIMRSFNQKSGFLIYFYQLLFG